MADYEITSSTESVSIWRSNWSLTAFSRVSWATVEFGRISEQHATDVSASGNSEAFSHSFLERNCFLKDLRCYQVFRSVHLLQTQLTFQGHNRRLFWRLFFPSNCVLQWRKSCHRQQQLRLRTDLQKEDALLSIDQFWCRKFPSVKCLYGTHQSCCFRQLRINGSKTAFMPELTK